MAYTTPLKDEFRYYLAHQAEFVKQHNGKVIVLKGQQLLGVYPDVPAAIAATVKQGHDLGTFLAQRVTPGDEAYTQTFHSRVIFQ